ncbi:hypothetical protein PG991_013519 [Apiospora marii]|uniref:Uncharacterized protein n=1 Tax=Apiospora marii TaxID=335849 RepID=A0ABR1R6C6_9PEZI
MTCLSLYSYAPPGAQRTITQVGTRVAAVPPWKGVKGAAFTKLRQAAPCLLLVAGVLVLCPGPVAVPKPARNGLSTVAGEHLDDDQTDAAAAVRGDGIGRPEHADRSRDLFDDGLAGVLEVVFPVEL